MSLSSLFKQLLLEKIEDEYDIEAYKNALHEWEKDDYRVYPLSDLDKEDLDKDMEKYAPGE